MAQERDPQVVQNFSEPIPKGGVNDWVVGGELWTKRGEVEGRGLESNNWWRALTGQIV